jgi:hypothetical protein
VILQKHHNHEPFIWSFFMGKGGYIDVRLYKY